MSILDELQTSYQNRNQVMEETGHESMLARVKAFHKMLTALTDEWETYLAHQDSDVQRPPKWIKSRKDSAFYSDMLLLFDSANIEDISINKKQYWRMRDLYDRSI